MIVADGSQKFYADAKLLKTAIPACLEHLTPFEEMRLPHKYRSPQTMKTRPCIQASGAKGDIGRQRGKYFAFQTHVFTRPRGIEMQELPPGETCEVTIRRKRRVTLRGSAEQHVCDKMRLGWLERGIRLKF